MVFELDKALESIRFAKGLVDGTIDEMDNDVDMESVDITKYKTIIFRNNSYLEVI